MTEKGWENIKDKGKSGNYEVLSSARQPAMKEVKPPAPKAAPKKAAPRKTAEPKIEDLRTTAKKSFEVDDADDDVQQEVKT